MPFLLFFLSLISILDARLITQTYSLKQLIRQRWILLSKFGSTGPTHYEIMAYFTGVPENLYDKKVSLKFDIYQHDKWEQVRNLDSCERTPYSQYNIVVDTLTSNQGTKGIYNGILSFGSGFHLWFVALNNCNKEIQNILNSNTKNIKLVVEIHTTTESGSEFSIEEQGYLELIGLLFIITSCGFYYFYRVLRNDHIKNGELDLAFLILVILIGMEALTNLFSSIHLLIYSYDGLGLGFLNVISELLQVLTNYGLNALFILIAWGWTVEFIAIEDYDLYVPIAFLIGFIQVVIVGLGKLLGSQYYYHCYDGWVGYTIMAIYLILFLYFFYSAGQRTKKGVDIFYRQFRIYGSLFFLSFPLFLIISKFVDPYKTFKIIMIGTMATRLISMLFLAQLFMGKNSAYRVISYKGKSFLDRGKMI